MLNDAQRRAIDDVIQTINGYAAGRRVLSVMFQELPDQEAWKEYYAVIPEPRSLGGIKADLEKRGNYQDALHLLSDLNLVFSNAIHFNEETSTIHKDAKTLQALLKTAWAANSALPQPKPSRPPTPSPAPPNMSNEPLTANLPPPVDDVDIPTLLERPRDMDADEAVRKLEAGLPRWQGPGDEGWMNQVAGDANVRLMDVLERIRSYKTASGDRLVEALEVIPEQATSRDVYLKGPLSFATIENRAKVRLYGTPQEFDRDLFHLFEKGRRHFEPGSPAYGRILVLQRLYQFLTSPSASSSAVLPPNFTAVPKAKQLRSVESTNDVGVTSFRIPSKDRQFTEQVAYKGVTYRAGDYVHLMNADDASRPYVGQIFKTYKAEGAPKGEQSLTICWYYRPEQTVHSADRQFWENEVFKSPHFAEHNMTDIIERVSVQFIAQHIRGRPQPPYWYPGWPIYVCESRYNDRSKEFTPISDPTPFIPEEIRKTDFMPMNHFAKVVIPRKSGSPFLKGVKGPGGIGGGGTAVGASGRRIRKNLLGLTAQSPSLQQLASTAAATAASASGSAATTAAAPAATVPRLQIPATRAAGSLQQQTRQRKVEDRSVITAAGGMPALGLNPSIDTLPPETVSLFEHDPTTNKLLWFSGPPLDMPPPSTYTPRYSTKYLAFLARQREEKQRKDGLSNTMDTDENGEGRAAKRQRMDLDEGEGEAREQNTGDAYVGGPIPTMMELVEKYLDGDAYLDDSLLEMEQEPPIGAAQNLERLVTRLQAQLSHITPGNGQ